MTQYAKERIANPTRFYGTPDGVLADDGLSHDEMEKVLQSMAVDAEQLVDATAEGMEVGDRTYRAEDLRLALAKLSEARESKPSSPDATVTSSRRFQEIVVVTTVSQDLNRVVLDFALDLSDMSGGTVSLLNVIPPTTGAVAPAAGMSIAATAEVVSVDTDEIIEDRKKLLSELKGEQGMDDTVKIEVRSGQIEEEIVKYTEATGADVILVGSPNRSWLEGLFNPPIDRSVTKFAPCPVLVVPEPD